MNFDRAELLSKRNSSGQLIYIHQKSFNGDDEFICNVCETVCFSDLELMYHDARVEHKTFSGQRKDEQLSTDNANFTDDNCMLKLNIFVWIKV